MQNLGISFEVITADVDESCDKTDPAEIVCELAARKAAAVAAQVGPTDRPILAADTLVACDGNIVTKPEKAVIYLAYIFNPVVAE